MIATFILARLIEQRRYWQHVAKHPRADKWKCKRCRKERHEWTLAMDGGKF